MKNIKTLWCKSPTEDFCNFGDTLTSYIFRPFNINAIYDTQNPEIIGVGSLIHMIPKNTNAYIFTTGTMYPTEEYYFKKDPIALRGKLTKAQFKKNDLSMTEMGDGGLLLEKIYKPNITYTSKYKLGIVPNYVDLINMRDDPLENFNICKDPSVCLIDPRNYVETVINQICSCENIISSSLHGLITSDSYGINNAPFCARESKMAMWRMQGYFKFRDYYSVYDQELSEPLYLDNKTTLEQALSICKQFNKPNLESIKQYLVKSVDRIKDI